ncbi:valine--tRNA ligase [Hirschia litorea]|uniref:Valine--tRNA ligase n=1 Tax=Hirschia litorea TaxID=1199156 RepID=A0ABW2IIK4_9PROT
MLDSHFDHSVSEPKIYDSWEKSGAFKPKMDTEGAADAYSIVIPPPNVTGVLHMGHALNNTLQDVLCRYQRMQGKSVLWQPGTDHAGIATQMVVERQLAAEGNQSAASLGRDAFIERVWEWKEKSGGQIINQLKRLGASCDWSRERFTLDEGLSKAVTKVFVELHQQGLIYRDKRLVNWDPHFQSAISDLEVDNVEVNGHMWHFKYPLQGGETYTYVEKDEDGNVILEEERDYISIATTRPETMLGDGAVAVHPSDERYKPIVGKLCEIPVGPKEQRRLIPIITDLYPDPEFGSGAVKITGAHDANDYGVAQRNNIPMYRLMDVKASMRDDGEPYAASAAKAREILASGEFTSSEIDQINLVPDEYRGMDRFEARKAVVQAITDEGLAVMVSQTKKVKDEDGNETEVTVSVPYVENKKIMQPFGDRSGVVIEPMLTDQWYVDAAKLAGPAVDAVKEGKTRFIPENWSKTYYNWMDGIEPWCISRQLWWGHRIPVWYGEMLGPDGRIDQSGKLKEFVAANEDEALAQARSYYGSKVKVQITEFAGHEIDGNTLVSIDLKRDDDVLDTWFSSALWPFSTMGWPDKTPELDKFYPTATLVTGFDIIFFWVARMMMQGIHFMKDVPFKDVYIHALVLDEDGKKMSKSIGNVIDPIDIIDGCDLDTLIAKRVRDIKKSGNEKKDKQAEKAITNTTKKQFPEGIPACGTDALRFTLASQAAQGRDIRLSIDRVVGYRNFGTKLWNAARFCEMNECALWEQHEFDPLKVEHTLNQWIVSEVAKATAEITKNIDEYRFNDAANAAYRFVWNVFCDWYLELMKPVLNGEEESAKAETRKTAAWTLDQIIHLLHPFMPFITEALWADQAEFRKDKDALLCNQSWPKFGPEASFPEAESEIDWVINAISDIRSARADLNVPAGAKLPVTVVGASEDTKERIRRYKSIIERLARLEDLNVSKTAPSGTVSVVAGEATFAIEVSGVIDLASERERLNKEISKIDSEMAGIDKKLANEKFVSRAPPEVVAEQHQRRTDFAAAKQKLNEALSTLEAIFK